MALTPYEPVGGSGGAPFDDSNILQVNDITKVEISKIVVRSGQWIDSIEVTYRDKTTKAESQPNPAYRGDGGGSEQTFQLGDGEYIIQISGRTGNYVDRLTISTNIQNRVFGRNGGGPDFAAPPPNGCDGSQEVIVFQGRSGAYLDAIGYFTRDHKIGN